MAVEIHPSAVVDPRAMLGDEVVIGPFCLVGPEVTLGARTRLHSHVVVTGHTTIGADNTIFPQCVIGGEPQDISYHGEPTRVEIGDHNVLREGVTVHRATTKEDGLTRIGSHNFLMAGCHVAHDVKMGSHIWMANLTALSGHVHVQDHAALSGVIGVHHFTTIGSYSFVGGCSRVTTDVPPFMLVEGNPSEVRCLNLVGLKRRGFSPLDIRNLSDAHRLLYRDRIGVAPARAQLESLGKWTPPVVQLFEFLDLQRQGRLGRGRERIRMAA